MRKLRLRQKMLLLVAYTIIVIGTVLSISTAKADESRLYCSVLTTYAFEITKFRAGGFTPQQTYHRLHQNNEINPELDKDIIKVINLVYNDELPPIRSADDVLAVTSAINEICLEKYGK